MSYNILWILIDGVRRHHSTDDRSRLDIMDEFGKESVEFLNVVTSAPSTFQSLSAMASGMHSYYINRNFEDFIFDNKQFPSITQTLKDAGYHCYSFLMHKTTREALVNVFPMIDIKYWPKGFSHNQWWDNSAINKAIERTLSIGVEKPSFFFVDYNCRRDRQTSDKVKWAIEKLKQAGYTKDNTITILCSDHGYPDPSKETGRPDFYREHNIGHDLVLTDDNIMIPLFIQYPGCAEGKKIETTVGGIDIFPTILDVLGMDIPSGVHGKSLIPLIDGEPEYKEMMELRFHRCDSRLSCQTGRGTAIRNNRYKYVYYHDDTRGKNEEFFDIVNDELETNDLIDSEDEDIRKQLDVFRKEFQESEKGATNFQLNYLFQKFSTEHNNEIQEAKEILITDSCSPLFVDMLVRMIRRINNQAKVNVLFVEHEPESVKEDVAAICPDASSWSEFKAATVREIFGSTKFDVLFAPYNTSEQRDNARFTAIVRRIKAKNKVYLDYNMGGFKTTVSYYWKLLNAGRPFARHKLLFFLTYIPFFINGFGRLIRKKLIRGFFKKGVNLAEVLKK